MLNFGHVPFERALGHLSGDSPRPRQLETPE